MSTPTGPAAPPAPLAAAGTLRGDQARLQQLHWLSVFAMALIALALPAIAPGQSAVPLFGVALGLAAASFAQRAGVAGGSAFAQLALDLVAWAAFLYFGGGVTNPAISLLLPLVAVGAAVLPPGRAWALALMAVAVYSLLWRFHVPVTLADPHLAMHLHLAGMWLSFTLSAATVVWFVSRMNAAVARHERDLAAANAARARDAYVVGLGKLAAGAAHRLGTPLATLRILAGELARRTDLADDVLEDVALMRRQIDDCKDILTGLTREAGQQRAEQGGTIAAGEWLAAVVSRWQRLRPHATASVRCEATASIVADASLGEALHNLIDNAANAQVAAGCADQAVEVSAMREADRLVVEVADRGPGIPPGLVDAARQGPLQERPAGMGVGLFLAHAAIEHHGGALTFRRRPGGGTIARFDLALQDSDR